MLTLYLYLYRVCSITLYVLCCCDSTPLIRRSCFDNVGLFNPDLPFLEDLDMWIRLAYVYEFAAIKEPLVRYRQHPQSKSTNCKGTLEAFRTIIEQAFESVPLNYYL